MLTHRQQVLGNGTAWNLSVMLGICLLMGAACRSANPRDRPWREPLSEANWPSQGENATERGVAAEEHASRLKRRSERARSLRIHMNADPGSLNPMRSPSVWALRIMRDNVFETLIRYRPVGDAADGSYQAGLAQRWSISPGGREIRLVLDERARWHDGKAVTALDVQFSLEAAMTKRGGAEHHRVALADLAAVEIVSRSAVRLHLERANAFVLRELASVPILPEHIYRRALDQRSGDWVGSGPYQVSREGDDVLLQRNAKYWGEAPLVEKIVFVRHQDAAIALREAKEGQMDIVPEMIREHYPEQLDIPGVYQSFSVLKLQPPIVPYIVLDTQEPPFDDANMRRAVSRLIDRATLIDMAGGLARGVPGLIWPAGPGNATAPPVPEFSVEQAAELLDQAGWRDDDGDGVRSQDGQRLMITVLATEGPHDTRDVILSALRKSGFVIDLRVGSAPVLRNRLRDGEFDLAFVTWSGSVDRDLSLVLGTGGANNYGRHRSPMVDELLTDIKEAWEPAQRKTLLATLAQLLERSTPLVALPVVNPHGLVHKRVTGVVVWDGWFAIRELGLSEELQ
ncbi:MAG: hypothetical protein GY811_15380 [Myxococcales bacterium]|nr:hypothetical protein [Myxococcales bacterium]